MEKALNALPRPPRYVIIAAAAATLLTLVPVVHFTIKHSRLSKRVDHESEISVRDLTTVIKQLDIKSVPLSDPDEPSGECRVFSDRCSRSIPRSLLPDLDVEQMLRIYLRRNMTEFASSPPAFLMRQQFKPYPEIVNSFNVDVIRGLEFNEGEWVNGYQVFYRAEGEVELGIAEKPQTRDAETGAWKGEGLFKGRLCIELREVREKRKINEMEDGEEEVESVEFVTKTVMYTRKDEKKQMPMEMGVARYMHEIGAWGLLLGGTDHLIEIARKRKKEL